MNTPPPLLRRTQERYFSAHHILLHTAQRNLKLAESDEVGSFNHCLVAMTLSALALEALANTVGDQIVDDWKDYESSSPYAKLRLLADHLQLPYIATQTPWPEIRQVLKFRNLIAHAKPEKIVEQRIITEAEHESRMFDIPMSKLEAFLTIGNARNAVNSVEAAKIMLGDAMDVDTRLAVFSDGWSGSTELA